MHRAVSRMLLLALTLAVALPISALAGDSDKEKEVLTIGAAVPTFKLTGTDGAKHQLEEYTKESKVTVLVFTCNTCPFSVAYEPVLINMAKGYDEGVQFVLINSNDPKVKPGDSFDEMVVRAKEQAYPFPYLYDATQEVAHAYGAKVTPHIFVVDDKNVLRYRGRINDNKDPEQVETHDLVDAIDAILAGEDVEVTDTRAFGCSIKWKESGKKASS